ncbi:hypothetical protein MRB53_041764 [Persea americana]|nr:hypothetical protein MRB53_041764 [Persea americana]
MLFLLSLYLSANCLVRDRGSPGYADPAPYSQPSSAERIWVVSHDPVRGRQWTSAVVEDCSTADMCCGVAYAEFQALLWRIHQHALIPVRARNARAFTTLVRQGGRMYDAEFFEFDCFDTWTWMRTISPFAAPPEWLVPIQGKFYARCPPGTYAYEYDLPLPSRAREDPQTSVLRKARCEPKPRPRGKTIDSFFTYSQAVTEVLRGILAYDNGYQLVPWEDRVVVSRQSSPIRDPERRANEP